MPIKSHTTPANTQNAAENPKPTIAGYEKPEVRFPLPKLYTLSAHEERLLQILLVISRRSDGCATPVESFICELVSNYGYFAPTPKDIERDLEELVMEWKMAVAVTRLFAQEHPELLAENAEETLHAS
jgi:hypothetical protein